MTVEPRLLVSTHGSRFSSYETLVLVGRSITPDQRRQRELTLSLNIDSIVRVLVVFTTNRLADLRSMRHQPQTEFSCVIDAGANGRQSMEQVPDNHPHQPPVPENESAGDKIITSAELLRGENEILIAHGDDVYRLRLTRNGKLILHK